MNWSDDEDDGEDADLVPCRLCGEPIYDEAESCPYCGEFVVESTNFLTNRPLWFRALWVVLVTFLIYQMIVWF